MYAPHTVTVFNVGEEDLMTFTRPIAATVLRGVLLDASKGVNVRESGLESADEVNLYIPFTVDARDVLTDSTRFFVDGKEYETTADKSGLWTLTTGDTFFAKGVVEEIADFITINKKYSDVYRVTKVDKKDFGTPDMQHFEVGGA